MAGVLPRCLVVAACCGSMHTVGVPKGSTNYGIILNFQKRELTLSSHDVGMTCISDKSTVPPFKLQVSLVSLALFFVSHCRIAILYKYLILC